MILTFNASDWYWQLPGDQVFSSKRGATVAIGDSGYQAFLAQGGFASICPDASGALTVAAIESMLESAYGLAVGAPTQAQLVAYANAKQAALFAAGITVNVGSASAPVEAVVATDAAGIGRVTTNIQMIGLAATLGKPAPTFQWDNGGGVTIPLNVAQMQTISWSMNVFLQATQQTIASVATAIADGAAKAFADIDAAAWPGTSY